MERFFLGRAGAIVYLMERRRAWFAKITAASSGNVELESAQIDMIERLVLDVRAGRVREFELHHPKPVAVFVTD